MIDNITDIIENIHTVSILFVITVNPTNRYASANEQLESSSRKLNIYESIYFGAQANLCPINQLGHTHYMRY